MRSDEKASTDGDVRKQEKHVGFRYPRGPLSFGDSMAFGSALGKLGEWVPLGKLID